MCCNAAPQSELQITISSQEPEPVVCPQAPGSADILAVSAHRYHNFRQLHRTRPLYLSLSCFLI